MRPGPAGRLYPHSANPPKSQAVKWTDLRKGVILTVDQGGETFVAQAEGETWTVRREDGSVFFEVDRDDADVFTATGGVTRTVGEHVKAAIRTMRRA